MIRNRGRHSWATDNVSTKRPQLHVSLCARHLFVRPIWVGGLQAHWIGVLLFSNDGRQASEGTLPWTLRGSASLQNSFLPFRILFERNGEYDSITPNVLWKRSSPSWPGKTCWSAHRWDWCPKGNCQSIWGIANPWWRSIYIIYYLYLLKCQSCLHKNINQTIPNQESKGPRGSTLAPVTSEQGEHFLEQTMHVMFVVYCVLTCTI